MDYIKFIFDTKVLLVLLLIYLLYKLDKARYNLHLKIGYKGPSPFPFLGNFPQLFRHGEFEFYKMCREKYGKIYPLYYGNVKTIMVSDEKLLKQILVSESKYFTNKKDYGYNGFYSKNMLHNLNGKDWKVQRNLLNPVFTSGKLRKMSPLILDAANLLEERLENHLVDKSIDFENVFGAFFMDVQARTMFGVYIDTQNNPNNIFMSNSKSLVEFDYFHSYLAYFYLFPELGKIFQNVSGNFEIKSPFGIPFFFNTLKRVIEERQKSSQTYNDFLSLMLNAQKKSDDNNPVNMNNLEKKSLTNHEIISQAVLFFLTGYCYPSYYTTVLAYFLAKNPDSQKELYTEIIEKIGIDGEITYELLMDMPILDAAINETLRICPSVAKIDKECNQDVILTSSDNKIIKVKKGDTLLIPVCAIHTDPSIWSQPDRFDLHRFDGENKNKHRPFSFMPFGIGPRNCIGMRFALLEMKWAIVTVLRKFELLSCEETPDTLKYKKSMFANHVKPILLKVVKRG